MNSKHLISAVIALFLFLSTTALTRAQSSKTIFLAGYNEHPSVSTAATGSVQVTVKDNTLTIKGSFTDLSSYYLGAGIYYGTKDENGNQMLKLSSNLNSDHTRGSFEISANTFKLTESLKQALHKGILYINIYSDDHPSGELRGQIPPLTSP